MSILPFPDFLANILQLTKLKRSYIRALTSPPYLHEFEIAFTHSSYNLSKNYEKYELYGDVIINHIIATFVVGKLGVDGPKGPPTDTIHRLITSTELAKYARSLHFDDYVLVGNSKTGIDLSEVIQAFKDSSGSAVPTLRWSGSAISLECRKVYEKLMGSLIESLCGCIVMCVDKFRKSNGKPPGVGYVAAYNFLLDYLNNASLTEPINYKKELKELYDALGKRYKPADPTSEYIWPFRTKTRIRSYNLYKPQTQRVGGGVCINHGTNPFTVEIYAYLPSKRGEEMPIPSPHSRKRIVSKVGIDQEALEQEACREALDLLDKEYGISISALES